MPIGRLKILIAGDEAVGKTSLIRRFVSETFNESYKATLGFEISVKNLRVDTVDFTLSLWDIGGQAAYSALRKQYYQNGDGYLLAFDLTNKNSFDHLSMWYKEIREVCPNSPIILIGTKSDLPNQKISQDQIKQIGNEIKAIQILQTSSKTGDGVNSAFNSICKEVINRSKKK